MMALTPINIQSITGVNNQILLFGRDLTQIAQIQQELMKTQLSLKSMTAMNHLIPNIG